MISQADLKRFASLAQTKYRQKYDQFLVEGRKAVEEVFHSQYQIDTILATEAFVAKHQPPFPFYTIPSKDMNRLSQFVSPPGIIAIVNKPKEVLATLQPGLNLVLDGIADPGNLGTILRIADWYGLRQLWLSDDCVDETNPKVIAASMGSFCRVTCLRNAESVWQTATSIFGADLDGTSLYNIEVPTTPYVLIMGSESHGLRPAFAKTLTQRLTIPRIGSAESLNVSVSTGIIMDRLLTQ